MMTIIEKAHALADAIVSSEDYLQLRKAEQDMMNDSSAQEVIDSYNTIQQRLHDPNENADDLKEQIEVVQREMENNSVISAYLEAQEKVAKILEEVNFILGRAINGEEEECDTEGCGGGCCGCS